MPSSSIQLRTGDRRLPNWSALCGAIFFLAMAIAAQFGLPGGVLRPVLRTTGIGYKTYDAVVASSTIVKQSSKVRSRSAPVWKLTASATTTLPDGTTFLVESIGVFGREKKFSSEAEAVAFQAKYVVAGNPCRIGKSIALDDSYIVSSFDRQNAAALAIGALTLLLFVAGNQDFERVSPVMQRRGVKPT